MAGQRTDRDRFIAFAFAAADLLLELDDRRRVVFASGAAKSLLGVAGGALMNREFMDFVPVADRSFAARVLDSLDRKGSAVRIEPVSLRLQRSEGEPPVRLLLGGCRFPDVSPNYFIALSSLGVGLATDDADRDPVTRLIGGDALAEAARRLAQQSTSEGGSHALTMLHVDGLERLQAGLDDGRRGEMMAEIGALLRSSSTGGDTAAQLSGTDFALVQKRGTDTNQLVEQLGQITGRVAGDHRPLAIRLAQVALNSLPADDHQAAQALVYCMKKFTDQAGDSFTLTTIAQGLAEMMGDTLQRVTAVKSVVASRDFRVVFQPIVDLKNRQIHHYEVLSRFNDGQNPYDFVTFSEGVGLVIDLDMAVTETVLDMQLRQPSSAPLAINVSGRSLQSQDFRQRLFRLLASKARDRSRLMFEITESSAIETLDEVDSFLQALRKAGHAICLDDFGSGFTAYTYLRRFQVDFVKIDGPFLKSGMSDLRDRALLKSVCTVCAELNARTIGEMVETKEEAYAAAGLGITHGQGYFFGKPVPMTNLPPPVPGANAIRRP